ncbi:hypothetical protein ACEQ8H_007484 [Pleosporales sp. CAS-2024a]
MMPRENANNPTQYASFSHPSQQQPGQSRSCLNTQQISSSATSAKRRKREDNGSTACSPVKKQAKAPQSNLQQLLDMLLQAKISTEEDQAIWHRLAQTRGDQGEQAFGKEIQHVMQQVHARIAEIEKQSAAEPTFEKKLEIELGRYVEELNTQEKLEAEANLGARQELKQPGNANNYCDSQTPSQAAESSNHHLSDAAGQDPQDQNYVYLAEEARRRRARKEELRSDPASLYRNYDEYVEHFPLGPNEQKNPFLQRLLANQSLKSTKPGEDV